MVPGSRRIGEERTPLGVTIDPETLAIGRRVPRDDAVTSVQRRLRIRGVPVDYSKDEVVELLDGNAFRDTVFHEDRHVHRTGKDTCAWEFSAKVDRGFTLQEMHQQYGGRMFEMAVWVVTPYRTDQRSAKDGVQPIKSKGARFFKAIADDGENTAAAAAENTATDNMTDVAPEGGPQQQTQDGPPTRKRRLGPPAGLEIDQTASKPGACVFFAVTQYLKYNQGKPISVEKLRLMIVQSMRKHKEKYEPLWRKTKPDAADSAASPEYNFEAYLVDLAKPDAWYSYLELHALASKCNIPIAILGEDADPIIINKEAAADATWCLSWVRDKHMTWLKGTPSDGLVTKLATKCHKAPYAGGRFGARTETCSEASFRTASSGLRSLGRAPKPRTARSNATFRTVITKAKRSNNTCRTRSNLSQCLAQAPAPTFRTRSNISQCSSRTTVVKPRLSKGKRLSDRRNSGNFAKKMAASSQLAVAEPRATGLKGHVGFRGADAHDSIFVRPLCDMTPAKISDAAARNYQGNVKRRGGMVLREWTCMPHMRIPCGRPEDYVRLFAAAAAPHRPISPRAEV